MSADAGKGLLGVLRREVGFGTAVETGEEPDRGMPRAVASAVITFTGVTLLIPNAIILLTPPLGLVGALLSLLGTVVSTGLIAGGVSLYLSRFSDRDAVRIAVWNVFGLVVFGSVMLGLFSYQESVGGVVVEQAFTIANLLAIAAAAHLLIGVYDARRARAEEQAAELVEAAGTVMAIHDRRGEANEERSLRDDAETAAESVRETHPDAEIEVDVPELTVRADPALPEAIEELVGSRVARSDAEKPHVTLRGERREEWITLEIRDNGPDIPEQEQQVVTGESENAHGSGLGLRVAQAVVDASNGQLAFGPHEEGAVVTLRLPPA